MPKLKLSAEQQRRKRIRKLFEGCRVAEDLTQQQLAQRAGIGRTAYRDYLVNPGRMRVDVMEKIAQALRIDQQELLTAMFGEMKP